MKNKKEMREPDLFLWVSFGLGAIFIMLSTVNSLGFLKWIGLFCLLLGVTRALLNLNKIFR